jgi:hypothetical protein
MFRHVDGRTFDMDQPTGKGTLVPFGNSQGDGIMSTVRALVVVPLMVLVAGCAGYYKVTEPGSGKEFYTQDVSRRGMGGSVEFKDAKTGATTTLQNSQVLEIDKKTYEAGLKAAKAPVPAPAAAPAPAATPASTPPQQ